MGLDMYAYRVNVGILADEDQVDFNGKLYPGKDVVVTGMDQNFAYWRKFNALHNWMEQLYRAKDGKQEVFNCALVRLTADDLDSLALKATNRELTPTAGFFFGDSTTPFSDEGAEEVLEFVTRAKTAVATGDAVVYDSWW